MNSGVGGGAAWQTECALDSNCMEEGRLPHLNTNFSSASLNRSAATTCLTCAPTPAAAATGSLAGAGPGLEVCSRVLLKLRRRLRSACPHNLHAPPPPPIHSSGCQYVAGKYQYACWCALLVVYLGFLRRRERFRLACCCPPLPPCLRLRVHLRRRSCTQSAPDPPPLLSSPLTEQRRQALGRRPLVSVQLGRAGQPAPSRRSRLRRSGQTLPVGSGLSPSEPLTPTPLPPRTATGATTARAAAPLEAAPATVPPSSPPPRPSPPPPTPSPTRPPPWRRAAPPRWRPPAWCPPPPAAAPATSRVGGAGLGFVLYSAACSGSSAALLSTSGCSTDRPNQLIYPCWLSCTGWPPPSIAPLQTASASTSLPTARTCWWWPARPVSQPCTLADQCSHACQVSMSRASWANTSDRYAPAHLNPLPTPSPPPAAAPSRPGLQLHGRKVWRHVHHVCRAQRG